MEKNTAKTIVKNFLIENGIEFSKLTAKEVGFSDLARSSKIFVKIHGWKPNPKLDELDVIAKKNNFIVETDWMF